MRMRILFLSFWLWSLTSGVALAASYCAIYAWGKACDFATYEDCLRAAGREGGCEFNPKEDKPAPGSAPYCLVTPFETKCIFDDASACHLAAKVQNSEIIKRAECVANPNR